MPKYRMTSRHFLVFWYRFARDMLFTALQRERYRPVSFLASLQDAETLQALRWRHKAAVDDLVSKSLTIESFDERDRLLAETDSMLRSLYFDRIHEATLKIEELCLRYTHLESDDPDQNKFVMDIVRRMLLGISLPFEN